MIDDDLYSPEVHAFILASETLLSPALDQAPLTPDECKVVELYASRLRDRCNGVTGPRS